MTPLESGPIYALVMKLRGFSLGHRLPGGFYGRAYLGSTSSGRRRVVRRGGAARVVVHLNAQDVIALKEQQRKDNAMVWKGIGIFMVLAFLLWPITNLDSSPFIAWPLLIAEIVVGLLGGMAFFGDWLEKTGRVPSAASPKGVATKRSAP